MTDVPAEWNRFFAPCPEGANMRHFRVVRRRSEPLLLLPIETRAAVLSLGFYPAQTTLAMAARSTLRMALAAHVPVPLTKVQLPWNDDAPLPRFLREHAGSRSFEIGVLLGNPNAEGRRWIIGVIADGKVQRVVKAGVTDRARELIASEATCLSRIPSYANGIPIVRGKLENDVSALALDFAPGEPPAGTAGREISVVLATWLDSSEVALADVPAWQRLRTAAAGEPLLTRVEQELGAAPFAGTIMHGDFTPWNIRVDNGNWTVLDWERGEMPGVPGWDWLHYAIQREVLVARRNSAETLARTRALLRSGVFQEFSRRARVAGRERALLTSYLLHAVHVLRQTEGLETMRQMLQAAAGSG